MAMYDSADLLAMCKRHARRPATDQAMPDAAWYAFLTEAQAEAYNDLFTRYPDLQYGPPTLMASADGGLTYTFGLDAAGDPVRPMGHTEIYPTLAAVPDAPLLPGTDFILEGAKIRMLNNKTRQFAAGPYARLVLTPDTAIDATHQPALLPKMARSLLVHLACEMWADRPGSGASGATYRARYDNAREHIWTALATAYNQQAAQVIGLVGGPWYTRLDIGPTFGINS